MLKYHDHLEILELSQSSQQVPESDAHFKSLSNSTATANCFQDKQGSWGEMIYHRRVLVSTGGSDWCLKKVSFLKFCLALHAAFQAHTVYLV